MGVRLLELSNGVAHSYSLWRLVSCENQVSVVFWLSLTPQFVICDLANLVEPPSLKGRGG